jgi:hypothetical protein
VTENLSLVGYEQTREKLAALEGRLQELLHRTDPRPAHWDEAKKSCETMIAQYRRELKLFEVMHPEVASSN